MACHCCGLCSKLNTLEGSVVNLQNRNNKSNHSSGMLRGVQATSEGRHLQDFCSIPSRSHQRGLSAAKHLQQKTLNIPNVSRNMASRSKISNNARNRERRTLAFVLHDEDFNDETLRTDNLSVEMQAFHTHVSPLIHTDNTNPGYADKHATKDFANGDLDDSEESEREVAGAICLSSFTFGSTDYLPYSLELITNGKKSLVRKLSSESCISMLSLDCTDDRLSAAESVEPFPSGDLSLQAEANIYDRANMVKPFVQFGGSNGIDSHWEPNLEPKREAIKLNCLSLPPLEKCRGTTKGRPEKGSRSYTRGKKRLSSATHERHRLLTRKVSLNLRACRGSAGLISGGTDICRAFNIGVGIGVSYMLFANWNELQKVNLCLERTESLLRDIQQKVLSTGSPLLGCFSNLENTNHREPANNVKASKLEGLRAHGAGETMLNMAELEAALEAELAVMQHNLEAELQISPEGSDEWNLNKHARTVEDLTGNPDQGGTSHCSAKNEDDTVNVHHMVSPNRLNKRLHEVLEVQQEERIMHLEAQVEARELDLLMKEKELQCWKDIAYHLANALPGKSAGRTEAYTIGQGEFCLADEGSRTEFGLSSAKHDARHHLLPRKREEFKRRGSMKTNRKRILDYESPARSNSFCESLSNSLIDPSFEALTLRNSLDWSIGVQSAEGEWKKEDASLSSHDDQDACDPFKDLDVDKMFPWLLHDECLGEAPHLGDSSLFTNSSLQQGDFAKKDSYRLNAAKR